MAGSWSERTHKIVKTLLVATAGTYFKLRFRLQAENLENLKNLPGPWLILPNHIMTWDPALISIYIRDPIHFVSSDANFRSPAAHRWLRRFGTIPTAKLATDFTTLRRIVDTLKKGSHVALFPEGERTWDGVSLPFISSTAKLVRLAGVSVVTPVIKGAYQSRPRWDYQTRPGPVTVEYKIAVTRDELKNLGLNEIEERIRKSIYHDDHEYQRSLQATYRSRTPAEPLQTLLFTCPDCKSLNTMHGEGERFFCRSCGWETRFTSKGCFEKVEPHRHYFDNIRQWNLLQQEELKKHLEAKISRQDEDAIFSDHPAVYSTGYKVETLEEQAIGTIDLGIRGIGFSPDNGSSRLEFAWRDINALNVVYQSQIEFYHQKVLHSFTFPGKDISGYKYLCAGRLLQESAENLPEQ